MLFSWSITKDADQVRVNIEFVSMSCYVFREGVKDKEKKKTQTGRVIINVIFDYLGMTDKYFKYSDHKACKYFNIYNSSFIKVSSAHKTSLQGLCWAFQPFTSLLPPGTCTWLVHAGGVLSFFFFKMDLCFLFLTTFHPLICWSTSSVVWVISAVSKTSWLLLLYSKNSCYAISFSSLPCLPKDFSQIKASNDITVLSSTANTLLLNNKLS